MRALLSTRRALRRIASTRFVHESPTSPAPIPLEHVVAAQQAAVMPPRPANPVLQTLMSEIARGRDAPFFVVDLDRVEQQHWHWKSMLPRVDPHYAIKCNPDPQLCSVLASLGAGFDAASQHEVDMALNAGASPDRIIYANPCKGPAYLRHAMSRGVTLMTFDNSDELHKAASLAPGARLVLRIKVDDTSSITRLGLKFGAEMEDVPDLARTAHELGLNLVGVSFHVGSGCFSASAYGDAVQLARRTFDMMAEAGHRPHLVDIGGGFPSHDGATAVRFADITSVLRSSLDQLFPSPDVRIISEPGRYYAGTTHTLAACVIGKRRVRPPPGSLGTKGYMYYLNDGVYGSFNCVMTDHATVHPQLLEEHSAFELVPPTELPPPHLVVDLPPPPVAELFVPEMARQELHVSEHALSVVSNVTGHALLPGGVHFISSPDALSAMANSTSSLSTMDGMAYKSPARAGPLFPSSLWGPTCDSIDCIMHESWLPELHVGDWLYFRNMGAYTAASSSTFNGFPLPQKVYLRGGVRVA